MDGGERREERQGERKQEAPARHPLARHGGSSEAAGETAIRRFSLSAAGPSSPACRLGCLRALASAAACVCGSSECAGGSSLGVLMGGAMAPQQRFILLTFVSFPN